jgi:hypothetical protein
MPPSIRKMALPSWTSGSRYSSLTDSGHRVFLIFYKSMTQFLLHTTFKQIRKIVKVLATHQGAKGKWAFALPALCKRLTAPYYA